MCLYRHLVHCEPELGWTLCTFMHYWGRCWTLTNYKHATSAQSVHWNAKRFPHFSKILHSFSTAMPAWHIAALVVPIEQTNGYKTPRLLSHIWMFLQWHVIDIFTVVCHIGFSKTLKYLKDKWRTRGGLQGVWWHISFCRWHVAMDRLRVITYSYSAEDEWNARGWCHRCWLALMTTITDGIIR